MSWGLLTPLAPPPPPSQGQIWVNIDVFMRILKFPFHRKLINIALNHCPVCHTNHTDCIFCLDGRLCFCSPGCLVNNKSKSCHTTVFDLSPKVVVLLLTGNILGQFSHDMGISVHCYSTSCTLICAWYISGSWLKSFLFRTAPTASHQHHLPSPACVPCQERTGSWAAWGVPRLHRLVYR